MNILITGGSGFIGSKLCKKYAKEGHTIHCLSRGNNINKVRSLIGKSNFKMHTGDVRDYKLLEKLMPGIDCVFHLAAQINAGLSITKPQLTFDINVLGTQNILELARTHDVGKIIFASSSEVYGTAIKSPIDEKHPLNGRHPYGASKIAADRMCFAYHKTYGLPVYIARFFNMYGPGSGNGGVIPIFTNKILNAQTPTLAGGGEQTRDFLFANDAIHAYDLLFNAKDNIAGHAINFGSGQSTSIKHIANKIIELTNSTLKPTIMPERPGDIKHAIADISKATEMLGFRAKTHIDEGLKQYIAWYKKYRNEPWTKTS